MRFLRTGGSISGAVTLPKNDDDTLSIDLSFIGVINLLILREISDRSRDLSGPGVKRRMAFACLAFDLLLVSLCCPSSSPRWWAFPVIPLLFSNLGKPLLAHKSMLPVLSAKVGATAFLNHKLGDLILWTDLHAARAVLQGGG